MSSALYVGAAAQTALFQRMDSLAHNVANAGTPGFRADGVKFDSLLTSTNGKQVAFPSAGRDYISTATGPAQKTGNPLDIAVRGGGWLSLLSPDGPVYTRDGRMTLTATGEIKSVSGYSLLDVSGAPMFADPSNGEINISGDGMMSQRGKQIGAVGLFAIDRASNLRRYDNSAVIPDTQTTPILDFAGNGVMQGFIEQSNVNPIRELTRLIEIQRAFENVTASMDMTDQTEQDAIKTLGATA